MGQAPKVFPVTCSERQKRLDKIEAFSISLSAAMEAFGAVAGSYDFDAMRSRWEEMEVIRQKLTALKQQYWRHRKDHGC
ncbi:MAG: hypothetical protein JWO80_1773 [Bryobacterales bacterium]|nr:hypothetical protein [Bryobacterales bacterium]